LLSFGPKSRRAERVVVIASLLFGVFFVLAWAWSFLFFNTYEVILLEKNSTGAFERTLAVLSSRGGLCISFSSDFQFPRYAPRAVPGFSYLAAVDAPEQYAPIERNPPTSVRRWPHFGLAGLGFVTYGLSGTAGTARAWGITIPYWLLCAGTSLFLIRFLIRRRRSDAESRSKLCATCGYDLTGNVSGRCPECGTLIDGAPDTSRNLPPMSPGIA
jgi:predicted RNA-binding Zn-ribbon protein involved in translation (DUF1610 family)